MPLTLLSAHALTRAVGPRTILDGVSLTVDDRTRAALEAWLARGGADIDARLDRAAAGAGLDPEQLDRVASRLSGGQRARVMLAAITAARSEVLLLDEPANHLDADGLERLRARPPHGYGDDMEWRLGRLRGRATPGASPRGGGPRASDRGAPPAARPRAGRSRAV